MKKWYLITAFLALLLVISMSTCLSNSTEVDRLKNEVAASNTELEQLREQSETLRDNYEKLQEEYAILQATKEMTFDKGIRLFDIRWKKGYWGILEGKVQNISNEPMPKVEIIVAEYNQDGSLDDVHSTVGINLFPQEIAEWSISGIFLENGSRYESQIKDILAIYAFGNR